MHLACDTAAHQDLSPGLRAAEMTAEKGTVAVFQLSLCLLPEEVSLSFCRSVSEEILTVWKVPSLTGK